MADEAERSGARLLDEQLAYYQARAPEYDEWWRRVGRYYRGPDVTSRWTAEVAELEAALDRFAPRGSVLELACGTGWWTERLARRADRLTCVDASPEVVALNRRRLLDAGLPTPAYVEADLFAWTPSARFDVVFFSFWLSHVPPERFQSFWATVAEVLAPGGRVFFIDSLAEETSTACDHRLPRVGDVVQERRLSDGRTFRVVKLFHHPDELAAELQQLGWEANVARTATYFLHGTAGRR
jgi:ubiquinone/menaquinone biosynthesis C-methylase UbiE